MENNMISGWYIGVYFHDIDDVKALTSPNAEQAFSQGYVRNIKQLVRLSVGFTAALLSHEGLQALRNKDIHFSESGVFVLDKTGNPCDLDLLNKLLGKTRDYPKVRIS